MFYKNKYSNFFNRRRNILQLVGRVRMLFNRNGLSYKIYFVRTLNLRFLRSERAEFQDIYHPIIFLSKLLFIVFKETFQVKPRIFSNTWNNIKQLVTYFNSKQFSSLFFFITCQIQNYWIATCLLYIALHSCQN